MYNCKICGKNLYKNITFNNMFRINYIVHKECIDNLLFNKEEQIIPIQSNIIIYDYVFIRLNEEFNKEYLWAKYFGDILDKNLKNKEWSVLIIVDDLVENLIKNNNPYLLLNLTQNPILFISLKEKNTSYLEGL